MTTFTKDASFDGAGFTEGANFDGAIFTKMANFHGAVFTKTASFICAGFTETAHFDGAIFTQAAHFDGAIFTQAAHFEYATFTEAASFEEVTFSEGADFHRATFREIGSFARTSFGSKIHDGAAGVGSPPIADFRYVRFLKPEMVQFVQINEQTTLGLRARFMHCPIEEVQFNAVKWHRQDSRIILQDELDVLTQQEIPNLKTSYELVAIVYRRLIKNFEQARAYDLVEDCTIGEFEMKRRDPNRFLFTHALGLVYGKFPLLRRWIGEQVSVVGLYRLASIYGTSYHRALLVLAFLLVGFGVLFSTAVSIHPVTSSEISTCSQSSSAGAFCGGLVHSLEVAALQRNTLYLPTDYAGRVAEIIEQVLVAGQVALLLFALQRRFRR